MDFVNNEASVRIRAMLFGSLVSCLFSDDPANECPFSRLRQTLTTEEKYDYVMKLNEVEMKYLLQIHDLCLQRRMSL